MASSWLSNTSTTSSQSKSNPSSPRSCKLSRQKRQSISDSPRPHPLSQISRRLSAVSAGPHSSWNHHPSSWLVQVFAPEAKVAQRFWLTPTVLLFEHGE